MRLSRLAKSRTNANVVQQSEIMDEKPSRHSLADLQSRRVVTTQRQLLHRQLSDTYAEPSAYFDSGEPPLYRAVSSSVLSQQIGATSPTPVTPTASIDAVQTLGAAPMGKLDIEQAINLLQELKKTASPEELVSLHRALLPVKEVSPIYSPRIAPTNNSVFSGSIPPDRRRSVMPPGLATRSGLSEDVLRRPQYSATVHAASRERREMWVHAAEREAGVKQTGAHCENPTRPETPAEQPNTGSCHSGTLRITNGAASPDPSIFSRIAAASADQYDQDRLNADLKGDLYSQQPERSRPSGPRHPQWPSRENLRAKTGERQLFPFATKQSPETRRFSFGNATEEPPSPSTARVQQTQSHRAAHLSQQYLMDCEISDSPFDERAAHLSLVPDVENGESGSPLDPLADTISKLTGIVTPTANADSARREVFTTIEANDILHDSGSPARAPRTTGICYDFDIPRSPPQQAAMNVIHAGDPSALAMPEPQTPVRTLSNQASSNKTQLPPDSTSVYILEDILGESHRDIAPGEPSANVAAKKSSPLSFFRSRPNLKKSSLVTMNEDTGTVTPSVSSSVHGKDLGPGKQTKRLQKRVPESIRRQRHLEADKQAAVDGGYEPTVSDNNINSAVSRTATSPDAPLNTDEHARTAPLVGTNDSDRPFRLRGKSFGRKRSKTNSSEHSAETVLHTPTFRSTASRGISASKNLTVSSDPSYHSQEDSKSTTLPKPVHDRNQSGGEDTRGSNAISLVTHGLPRDIPVPKSPPRATLEGSQRAIPIGAHGSVGDLFPEWQSRPATTPLPSSSQPPTRLQVMQFHKPRSIMSVSSIPPLPELPADIEAKVSRADHMVAKKMMNSPRNSARNSPQPSARNSVDSPSHLTKKSVSRVVALQTDFVDRLHLETSSEPTRWSIDGSILLPPAAKQSKPASPTHDTQHPGWPGWEKQAEMWRQRKIDLGYVFTDSVHLASELTIESEPELPSPSVVVSQYNVPIGTNTTREMRAEKLAEAYSRLFEHDKENWPAQQNMQRTDSVDSTTTSSTASSEGREAKTDISWSGSAYSNASSTATAASSNSSPGNLPKPLVETKAGTQTFTPYRPADAIRAERSRALSLARRSCLNMPQNGSIPVFDRYSGGLGYGWDRNTGFGGSAGTRSSGTEAANRKSIKISEDYGLDLSDVPVFLRKVQA